MEKILELTLLYDFYGELLTDRQKKICELYYLNDFSLGEISEILSISRQGVHDTLKRSQKQLYYYEQKLQMVNRFIKQKDITTKLLNIIDDILKNIDNNKFVSKKLLLIKDYANKIIEND